MERPRVEERQLAPLKCCAQAAARMTAVLSQEGPEQAVAELLRLLREATGADAALIATAEPGAMELRGRGPAIGIGDASLRALQIATRGGAAAILDGCPALLIDDPMRAGRLLPDQAVRQALAVDLKAAGRSRGLLILASKRAGVLGGDDLQIASIAGNLIATALAMAEDRRAIDGLEQTNSGWRELLGQVSHELRVALTPILTWSQILGRQARLERRWQKAIDVIQRNTRDQARLVDDLLGTSGFLPCSGPAQPSRMDLGEQVKLAAEAVKPQADARQVAIRIDLPGAGPVIDADPQGTRQIVANLLRNAVRNAPRGGFVALRAISENGAALLRVTEPPEDEAGQRVSTPGMNLSHTLIKEMVERYGGRLRTAPGDTNWLEVLLPGAGAEPAEDHARPRKLQGLELLVIEDHDDSREALAALLEAHGARVRTAASGEAGIEIALEDRPSVILCDLAMPGMDGYEVARRLRERLGWQKVTLLALSGHGEAADLARAHAAGFSAHLLKPVETNRLLEMVEAGAQN